MATATAPPAEQTELDKAPVKQLQLFAGMDGRKPAAAKLSISGGVDLESHDDRDHRLAERLQFGRRVAIVLIVGDEDDRDEQITRIQDALGSDTATVIDGMVTSKGHKGVIDSEVGYLDKHVLQIGIKLGGLSHGPEDEPEPDPED